jgi:NAD(P)H-hydrate epimerase
VPSGLDASTGRIFDPAIQATATMTLALPKEGLQSAMAQQFLGELYLANIGVPGELYAQPTVELKVENVFRQNDLVRLR